MYVRRGHKRIAILMGIMFLFMAQYQNCAPVKSSGMPVEFNPDQVGIIDRDQVHKGTEISFFDESVELSNQFLSTYVQGFCDASQSGSVMSWNLENLQSGGFVESGTAVCQSGRFFISVDINSLECGVPYALRAEFGFDKGDEVSVSKRCPQIASHIEDARMTQVNAICFMESSAHDTCVKSCYQEARLYIEEELPAESCTN